MLSGYPASRTEEGDSLSGGQSGGCCISSLVPDVTNFTLLSPVCASFEAGFRVEKDREPRKWITQNLQKVDGSDSCYYRRRRQ